MTENELVKVDTTQTDQGSVCAASGPKLQLRDPQREAIECWEATSKRRVIISLPTGCGKTLTGLWIVRHKVKGRILWIAHRDELIEQPIKEIEEFFPGLTYGVVKAQQNEYVKNFIFASVQTLANQKRLQQIIEANELAGPIDLVVYDECLPGDETVPTNLGVMRMDDPRLASAYVLAVSSNGSVVSRRVLRHVVRNERPLLRVTTRSGRSIRCTNDEKFLSNGTWKQLSDLSPGDPIQTFDTARAPVGADHEWWFSDRSIATASKTGGRKEATSSVVTEPQLTCRKEHALRARVAAASLLSLGFDSSAIISDESRQVSTRACWVESSEPSSVTRASVANPKRAHGFTSPTVSCRRNGLSTRCLSCPNSTGGRGSSKTKALENGRSSDAREVGPNCTSSVTSSSQMGRETTSESQRPGSTGLTRRAERGGTWTTEPSPRLVTAFSTPKASVEVSPTSSRNGSAASVSSPTRTNRPVRTAKSSTLSECEANLRDGGVKSFASSRLSPCFTSSDYIESIEPAGLETVYDIEVEKDHNFITSSGFVVHNCHHSVSRSAKKILTQLGCFKPDGPKLLGLTATIDRSDKVSLADVFEEIVYKYPIKEAIKNLYLVQPEVVSVPLPINPKALRIVNGDFSATDLDRELVRTDAARATAIAIKEHIGAELKTIVFTTSVDQAKKTAEECQKVGLDANWISGSPHMKKSERKQVIKALAAGETKIVICSDLLIEGFDDKSVGGVVIAKPTLSQGRYCQMAGRGLRAFAHKKTCKIIDLVFASDLGLVTGDILLKTKEKKVGKKRSKSIVTDSYDEWRKVKSYLQNAKVDFVEHGEVTFARASDNLYVTAAKDGDLVVLRRVAKPEDEDDDKWVIEHQGIVYSYAPESLQNTMSTCEILMPTFGGSAGPDSPEWRTAAEKPAPSVGRPVEEIAEPMPLPTILQAEDVKAFEDAVRKKVEDRPRNEFAVLVGHAIRLGKCHLFGPDKVAPKDQEQWGWSQGAPQGEMLGWVQGNGLYLDPVKALEVIVPLAAELSARVPDVTVTDLRKLFPTKKRVFKGRDVQWILVNTSSVFPHSGGQDEPALEPEPEPASAEPESKEEVLEW